MDKDHSVARLVYNNPDYFAYKASGRLLRSYQRDVLNAVIQSIREKAGRSFVVIFSRQSGKNELQAQMFAYLLASLSNYRLNIVSVSPTYKPQTLNAMNRLETVLSRNLFTRLLWKRTEGFKYRVGRCMVIFLSGDPSANVVGETAHILLSVDEAQDIEINRFDKAFAPMTAAHNATRVFWGTSWTSNTLLSRERRSAQLAQESDGIRRVWIVPGPEVAKEVPSYADFLEAEIQHLGRNHPIIRTQYFCEEIDAQAGMFNTARLALMQGDEPAQDSPATGRGGFEPPSAVSAPRGADAPRPCAFLLDIAGQDEARMRVSPGSSTGSLSESAPLSNPGRDSVSLTIASIDLSSIATLQAPTYRFVHRQQWTGQNHLVIFGKLKSLVESWKPQHIVIDATGVGEGLWAMLDKAFPGRVIPVKFSQKSKSEIGWRYLAIIETGRVRDCCGGLAPEVRETGAHEPRLPQAAIGRFGEMTRRTTPHEGQMSTSDKVLAQYLACQSEILPGPGKVLRWGVPEGARGPDGELIHDDYLLADALIAEIDRLEWTLKTEARTVEAVDPLISMESYF